MLQYIALLSMYYRSSSQTSFLNKNLSFFSCWDIPNNPRWGSHKFNKLVISLLENIF